MKIAVTGASGFVGRHLCQQIQNAGHELTIWAGRDANALDKTKPDPTSRRSVVYGRLGSGLSDAIKLCRGQDAVVHAGWWTPGDSFIGGEGNVTEYFRINVVGSLALLEAAVECGVKRFIFISTGAVHGEIVSDKVFDESHPRTARSIYGSAKAAVETMIESMRPERRFMLGGDNDASQPTAACNLRPTSVYGVNDPIDSSRDYDLIRDVARGMDVNVKGGGKRVAVDDLAAAAIHLANRPQKEIAGQTFNCTGGWVSQHQVASTAKRLSGASGSIVGDEPSEGKVMSTRKLEATGFRFDQNRHLEATIATIIGHIRSAGG